MTKPAVNKNVWIVAGIQGVGKTTLVGDPAIRRRLTGSASIDRKYFAVNRLITDIPPTPHMVHWSLSVAVISRMDEEFELAAPWLPRVIGSYYLLAPVNLVAERIQKRHDAGNDRHAPTTVSGAMQVYLNWQRCCAKHGIPLTCLDSRDRRYRVVPPTDNDVLAVLKGITRKPTCQPTKKKSRR